MKTEKKSQWANEAGKNAPKIKTLNMKVSATHHDLGVAVRKAFDLAKSAGQELNLSFSVGNG